MVKVKYSPGLIVRLLRAGVVPRSHPTEEARALSQWLEQRFKAHFIADGNDFWLEFENEQDLILFLRSYG